MTGRFIAAAKSAYQYPLIIKHLWHAPLLQARRSGDRLSRLEVASPTASSGGGLVA